MTDLQLYFSFGFKKFWDIIESKNINKSLYLYLSYAVIFAFGFGISFILMFYSWYYLIISGILMLIIAHSLVFVGHRDIYEGSENSHQYPVYWIMRLFLFMIMFSCIAINLHSTYSMGGIWVLMVIIIFGLIMVETSFEYYSSFLLHDTDHEAEPYEAAMYLYPEESNSNSFLDAVNIIPHYIKRGTFFIIHNLDDYLMGSVLVKHALTKSDLGEIWYKDNKILTTYTGAMWENSLRLLAVLFICNIPLVGVYALAIGLNLLWIGLIVYRYIKTLYYYAE